MSDKKILAIITARGGSKGLPGKNIKLICGKPLIVHTIERALAIGTDIYKVLVSTDDRKIAEISKNAGAYVPFLRPEVLATDTATSLDVVRHAVNYVEMKDGIKLDWSMVLQPTTPLRTKQDISNAIQLTNRDGIDTVISVYNETHAHPAHMKRINSEGLLEPFLDGATMDTRRQDRKPDAYLTNGGIYMTRRDVLESGRLIGDHIFPYIMPVERSVDIDNKVDFLLADILMQEQLELE